MVRLTLLLAVMVAICLAVIVVPTAARPYRPTTTSTAPPAASTRSTAHRTQTRHDTTLERSTTITTTATVPTTTTTRPPPATAALPAPSIGVCLSGLEDGNKVPGKPGVDYAIPQQWEYAYFKSKHLTMIRLPFRWERIQPTLGGALDSNMANILKNQLAIAAALNMTILIDCHNYARYNNYILNGTTGPLTTAIFADFWLRMATEFKGLPGLHGYDLQNEPNTMPDLHVWPQAAQAAILAIRTVDTVTPIYVEGNQWSGAANWQENNPDFPLHDPVNRIVYSTHCYLDRDGSGTHFLVEGRSGS